jgi:hypothetical protein
MNGASQMRIGIIKGNKISVAKFEVHTRAVRQVSSHFEYIENRSRGPDVGCQLVRGGLLRIRKQSLSRGASQSAVRRR